MKRIMAAILFAGCAIFAVNLASGGTAPSKSTQVGEPKGTEYHHLLMLDLREAAEHARTLHHYARMHAKNLDKAVLTRHTEELKRNLDGAQAELAKVEENRTPGETPAWVASIRTQRDEAQRELDALLIEVGKESPEASVVEARSLAIHEAMTRATTSHHQLMVKRGVHEPAAMAKSSELKK